MHIGKKANKYNQCDYASILENSHIDAINVAMHPLTQVI